MTQTFIPADLEATDFVPLQSPSRQPGAAQSPVLHLRYGAGKVTHSGDVSAFVGHRVGPRDSSLGLYGSWQWDGDTLRAEVDPLGFFSLFVYQNGTEIALSPSILQLLALGADPEPDRVALAVFHRIGSFLGEDTPFRHIKVLPPGGKLVWREGVATVTGNLAIPREQALRSSSTARQVTWNVRSSPGSRRLMYH